MVKTLFFHLVWSPTSFSPKNQVILRRKPFFFGFHLFLDQKRVRPRNPAPGATILSNNTAFYDRFFGGVWTAARVRGATHGVYLPLFYFSRLDKILSCSRPLDIELVE